MSSDEALLLRPWRNDDAVVLQGAYQDATIRRWSLRRMPSRAAAEEWIADAGRQWQEERGAQWAVTDADGGQIVGRVALRSMDLFVGLAECAYWVLPELRGHGVAPRSLATLSDWALEHVHFHRLELAHSVRNHASCRVADKTGFGFEGVRRSSVRHADGWHDMHLHARAQGDADPVVRHEESCPERSDQSRGPNASRPGRARSGTAARPAH
ncbi:GNAT family N-acetyltransferase [Streptomyces sp. YIM 130001]|uniref:GNAT family N-acetyltransferase n=1 Tax=Streptomyces sp. YIM 130001 TaxID=2259644 RepID=UPI0013C51F64